MKKISSFLATRSNEANLKIIKTFDQKANRNLTLMIISTTSLVIFTSIPKNYYNFHKYLLTSNQNQTLPTLNYISLLLLIFSCSLNVFFYFIFNKLFRKTIIGYFVWFRK